MNALSSQPHTLFISDLHLDESEAQITATFLDFLEHQATEAEALYILGDFFEVWIGDHDHTHYNRKIITALRQYSDRGIPVYFMHGNRDFFIGHHFAKAAGIKIIKDPTIIELYGQSILLMHGDSLCTRDIRHQKTRKIMHSKLCQKVVLLCTTLEFRRRKASQYREESRKRGKALAADIVDVTTEEVTRVMHKHDVQLLVHGHTHRPAMHQLTINNQFAQRIVLGSWHDCGSVLVFPNEGKPSLETLAFQ